MSTIVKEAPTFEKLEELRDELKLKIHLGKAEAKDLWDELDEKWRDVQSHRQRLERAGARSAADIKAASRLLLEELGEGYERIRRAL